MLKATAASVTIFITFAVQASDITTVVTDADFLAKGYASIDISGFISKEETRTVHLSVVGVENLSQAVIPSFKHKKSGLSWNEPCVGSTEEIRDIKVQTNKDGKWSIRLFDVMGERKITLVATWTQSGDKIQRNIVVRTGNGPLSRFNCPELKPLTWFDLYEQCNGSPYKGDPGQWYLRAPAEGGPRFPGGLDIQSVAGFGKYSKVPAWGAAIAAGWPTTPYRWWLGTVSMAHRVRHMDLATGNPHGSGGAFPGTLGFGVCLKQNQTPQSDIPVWSREEAERFVRQMRGKHPTR